MISSALAVLAGGFLLFGTGRSLAQRQTPVWVSRAVQLSGVFSALWGVCRLVSSAPLGVSEHLASLIQRLGFYAGGGFVGIWLLIIINGQLKAMLSRCTNEAEQTRPPNP
jgi:hypothetical protein